MTNTFRLIVSTPDGHRFEGDVTNISLRGVEGDLAVMAGHIPFATIVSAGKVEITDSDGKTKTASTKGGILTVGEKETALLCGVFDFE